MNPVLKDNVETHIDRWELKHHAKKHEPHYFSTNKYKAHLQLYNLKI
uniref:Uncharacterized protein n=1 Tax=Rhizophora mucronata TaxID=61149 RepID=A0A2P2M6Z1_RHIMU